MNRKKQNKEMKEVRERWETETGTRRNTASRKESEQRNKRCQRGVGDRARDKKK